MPLEFIPVPTTQVRAYQDGAVDAYGHAPEISVSDGQGNPCRHCLKMIPKGARFLILAHRPFSVLHPYAETGPIFLCADPCEAPADPVAFPEILDSPTYILRGYSADQRIVYGTGGVVARTDITARAASLLEDSKVVSVHVRSAKNNCFQVKIEAA